MKLGNLKNIFFIIAFIIFNNQLAFADNKIKTVPLINLDELSPTFEEDEIKEELILIGTKISNDSQQILDLLKILDY